MKSEFGAGLSYCLGLFLAHAERYKSEIEMDFRREHGMTSNLGWQWFNASSDHLFDLIIPASLPKSLKRRLKRFQSYCLKRRDVWGGEEVVDMKDIDCAIAEAKSLLLAIDKAYKIKAVRSGCQ
jgi:hypothetical protein